VQCLRLYTWILQNAPTVGDTVRYTPVVDDGDMIPQGYVSAVGYMVW